MFGLKRMDPVYDTAYYEDLAGRLYGLVVRLGDRLPTDQERSDMLALAKRPIRAGNTLDTTAPGHGRAPARAGA